MRASTLAVLMAVSVCTGQWLETTIEVGGQPYALAYSTASNRLYCANRLSCDVSVICGSTNVVVGSIPLGSEPWSSCYNPVNNRLYCGLDRLECVKVIDCERDSVVATVPMGRIVRDMCYVAEVGKVYVAMFKNREASGQVAIIDGATNRLLRRVDAGEVTHVVCYNPANNSVYCANWRDGTVTVIDGASDSVSATVLLGRNPYALASNARENRVYCACPEPLLPSGTLIVIDGVTGGIVDRLPVYGLPSAVCCNERTNKIYCASDYHDQHPPVAEAWLEIWDGQTGSLLRQMRVGREYPCSLYCCEWSNKVYCADRDAGTVTVIDGNTDAIVCVIPVGLGPMSFAGNPRFGRVYVNLAGESAVAVIRDTVGVGLNGSHRAPARCSPQASIARGVLQLESIAGSSQLAAELLDIIGRKVMDLLPGANDIRHVAPGVYFVRTAESGTRSAVRKVVIQR